MINFFRILILFIFSLISFLNLGTINIYALGANNTQVEIDYCNGEACGLEEGIDLVKTSISDIDTDGNASDKIQDIVKYLLGFITLIAVIYIIYSGFRILTSSGEDEVIKNSKKTIIYVIIGILVIRFAWAIANFAVSIGTGGK